MTNMTNKLETVEPGDFLEYLGGDPQDSFGMLEVGKSYLVVVTGSAENRETGEEFPMVAVLVPHAGGHWAIIDAPDDTDVTNAHCFKQA